MGEDTDTLLAIVSSLLPDHSYDQETLLTTLLDCEGDVDRTVQRLSTRVQAGSSSRSSGVKATKRKSAGLDDWLGAKSPDTSAEQDKPLKRVRSAQSPRKGEETLPSDESVVVNESSPNASPRKQVTKEEFMAAFHRPTNSKVKPPHMKKVPLTLATPELIKRHTPCTMHLSILPPELACRLFYVMLDLSRDWQRNKWYLFDRLVESPHRTSFFVRQALLDSEKSASNDKEMEEAGNYWYNGRRTGPSPPFPDVMEEACQYIEQVVNAELRKRPRYPLEWGGEYDPNSDESSSEKVLWRANVAASNCYEGAQESVGFHTDALTYLGPYPTIASLSLGTTRTFRLREVVPSDEKEERSARTFNIPLPHNSLTIMHASCQEMFKHSIPPQRVIDLFHPPYPPPSHLCSLRGKSDGPPETVEACQGDTNLEDDSERFSSNARINITFRFFRPDYRPSTTPKCKCGLPCILRPDMKNRYSLPTTANSAAAKGDHGTRSDGVVKYWWACNSGAQTETKGCGMWQVMDVKAEGRGPFAGELV